MAKQEHPLGDTEIFNICAEQALRSTCEKMHFGCVIALQGQILYRGFNSRRAELKEFCEGGCIRLRIPSRREPMLGSCSHAEELIWEAIRDGVELHRCDLYVAGFHPNGLPWDRPGPVHTCLRCAIQIHNARLASVCVPFAGHWWKLGTCEAVATAMAYIRDDTGASGRRRT